jgi:Flp pilus assembly protein TadD
MFTKSLLTSCPQYNHHPRKPGICVTAAATANTIKSHFVSNATLPSRSAAEHHEVAFALAGQRRFAEAVREYNEAARLEPNDPKTFYNLAIAYGELSQWKSAINAYKRAIQLDPKDWQVHCNLGVDYVNSRQYAKAIQAFRRAAELNPQEMSLFVSIGFNCGRLKRYSEAIDAYAHAIDLQPDFAVGWYNIALFQFHLHHSVKRPLLPKRH